MNSNWNYSPETPNLGQNRLFFLAVRTWNLTDDLQKQQGTSPKHYQAICIISSSYVNSNWSYSPQTPNLGQIRRFLEPRDLEIWRMTFKTIGHLFYATSSFVQHFVAIGELILELQSGNAQSGSNSTMFRAVRPWNLTDDSKIAAMACAICAVTRFPEKKL